MTTIQHHARIALIAAAAALATVGAQASTVTSIAGGTVIDMPTVNLRAGTTQSLGPAITWSSTYGDSVYGYNGGYGFAANGYWDSALTMVGLNSDTGSMTFAFADAVTDVGGFINFAPGYGDGTTIAVYDTNNVLIESSAVTFATDGSNNSGQFMGFHADTASIGYFTLSNGYIGLSGLTVNTVPAVPEPETYALMLGGLGIVGFMARRRQNRA